MPKEPGAFFGVAAKGTRRGVIPGAQSKDLGKFCKERGGTGIDKKRELRPRVRTIGTQRTREIR